MGIGSFDIGGVKAIISRSGYTGEDGVEISVPADQAEVFARRLLALPGVMPAGLGARDSLRLEAGLCLYGSDIDQTTSPVEAGLVWTIGKRRRMAWDFPGAERVRAELADGPRRRRVGVLPEGRQPARAGTAVLHDGVPVGTVTSGSFGPTLDAPCAMAYVAPAAAADGTTLTLDLRGRPTAARVVPLPFVPHRVLR
jgi:aminomethyltransferase